MAKKITSRKPQRRSRGGFPIDNAPVPQSLDSINLNAAGTPVDIQQLQAVLDQFHEVD